MIPTSQAPRVTAALAVFLLCAPLYLATTAQSVGFLDRGELAAVATTLGIAHPSGYPTLTLLAHAVTRLAPRHPLRALDGFAALLVALGAGGLALVFERLLAAGIPGRPPAAPAPHDRARPRARRGAEKAPRAPLSPVARAWCAALAAALVATGAIYWQQANGFEVYPF